MRDRAAVVLALKLIAVKAEKLARDLENNQLWEGDLGRGLGQISEALDDARRDAQ